MSTNERQLTSMLGEAVKRAWAELPQHIQEMLFEEALLASDSSNSDGLRHELALLLHERHPRTAEHT